MKIGGTSDRLRGVFKRRNLFLALGTCVVFVAAPLCLTDAGRWAVSRAYFEVSSRIGERKIDFQQAEARLREKLPPDVEYPLRLSRIVISKNQKRLQLYEQDRLLVSYPCVFGSDPIGSKSREGDGKTPEGNYFICTRLDQSRFHLFMGINYPNTDDAERGRDLGLIDDDAHRAMLSSEGKKATPPWHTKMGGAVGIHGGGTPFDWTAGCIAVANNDIEELWVATHHWTPVTITE